MSKKRKPNNSSSKLSPEKYLRTKSRQLPVKECLINSDWEETRMANVTVSRQHSNGNITFCIYLVDLLCMGVKDSDYHFNISSFEYEDFKDNLTNGMPISHIDYTLAHNIIFAGFEFALDMDIQSCKIFSQTTQYFLDEDNDEVELVEIECGENGKPVVIKGEYNLKEADKTYYHLCNTLGKDNVTLTDLSEDYEEDEFFTDEGFPLENYRYNEPLKERYKDIQQFKILNQRIEKLNEEEFFEIHELSKRLFYNHFSYDEIDESRERIYNFFDLDVIDTIPDHLLGFDAEKNPKLMDKVNEILDNLSENINYDIEKEIKNNDHIPFLKYLHLKSIEAKPEENHESSPDIISLTDKYIDKHPDYFLLHLLKDTYLYRAGREGVLVPSFIEDEKTLFDIFIDREWLYSTEMLAIIYALFEYFLYHDDILSIDIMVMHCQHEYPILETDMKFLLISNSLIKNKFCEIHYINDKE